MRTPQEIEAHLEDVLSALSDSQEHAQIVRLERRTQELRDELTKAKATHHMTDYEKGRAAGLAEAVKVAEAYAAGYSAQIKRLQASLPPRGGPERTAILDDIAHDSGLLETAVEIAKSLRALSTSPGEHVLVPREPSDAMIEAALATGVFDTNQNGSDADAVTKAYRAMLSAKE